MLTVSHVAFATAPQVYPRFARTTPAHLPDVTTLTVHDVMALRGCSRAQAYRILARGAAAGSLTLTTETCVGGNGARQRRRVVVVETAGQ